MAWVWVVTIVMEHRGMKGGSQAPGLNSWAGDAPVPEVREAGMSSLGWRWGEGSVSVSFLLGWKFFEVRGLSY